MSKLYGLLNSGSILNLFLQVVPITLLIGVIYAAYRCVRIKRHRNTVRWGTEIMRWLFVCYLTGLINLILVPSNLWSYIWFYLRNGYGGGELYPLFSGGVNLVPTLIKVLTGEFTVGRWVRTMLAGNFLMFVPMGFFLPFVFGKINHRNIWKIAVLIPIFVEAVQLIVGRSFDLDDLILNFAGIIAGYFVAFGIKNILGKIAKP
jgi:glycopeptide antibiotics resistance protein